MNSVWLGIAALLLVVGTAAAGSLPRVELRVEERVLIGAVVTVLVGSAVTYVLALLAGLSVATVLGGEAITVLAVGGVTWRHREAALADWRNGWDHLLSPEQRRRRVGLAVTAFVTTVLFTVLFSHTLSVAADGTINAGFETVWADWAQHLTTASSFAVGHNLPPQNPLFSGQDLRYPFLPDFQSATLVVLGASPAVALALPGALLAICITLLIVTLAVRLGAGLGAGIIAAVVCLVGGGLGFTGILADSCVHHGFTAAQCSWSGFFAHPVEIPSVIAGTLHDLPGMVAAQPRAYDGLLTAAAQQPLPNQQWYTPLFAWWLPQRSILYGFAGALAVLTMLAAAARAPRRGYETFALAGVLLGLMPLIHIHTLIAMAIVLGLIALQWRHRGWWITLAVTVVVAIPRLASLGGGPRGSVLAGNAFPTIEPGWMYLGGSGDRSPLTAATLVQGFVGFLRALLSPQYWGFWIANTGVAVPLCAVVLLAVAASRFHGAIGAAARRLTAAFPTDLLRVALPFVAVFGVANIVVFQSWDWDNTKLFTYWYLGVALLLGALIVRWWRRWWLRVAAFSLASTVLLTGTLVLLRLLPWTPPAEAVGGPYTSASADDVRLATRVAASTAPDAIFLTEGRPNDPIIMLAGRTAVMGYYGWLWSYGTDFGSRYNDVRSMLEGCPDQVRSRCSVFGMLHQYRVGYVEIDDRLTAPGVVDIQVGLKWWAGQGLPVVASSDHVTVYDVRGA
ncbi:MAG: hypothetical protein JF887_03210 [Candidatus Dormibacteraeota bacterium]|uniref:Uncharacterized protein n=1 Tax=Candidatus Amunia macphersoniae TaxID=3127014 RepID=A0A934KIJ1_9BACT|nr:hypothetical protein [Candidatus Dormibacteraeota bacterium]